MLKVDENSKSKVILKKTLSLETYFFTTLSNTRSSHHELTEQK